MVNAVFTVVNYLMLVFDRRWSREYSATIEKLNKRNYRATLRVGSIVFGILGVVVTVSFLIYNRRSRAY